MRASGWERVALAVENVRRRLLRASTALDRANIAYAVAGGNAVAEWVGRADLAAVRNTQDVDIMIRREDLPAVTSALTAVGFVYRLGAGIHMFLDGPEAKARDAVHIVFAGEKVRAAYPVSAPDLSESEAAPNFRVLKLAALVRMKLTSFRDKDRTHLRDLIDVGLVDASWVDQLPAELAERLQELLANPEG